MTDRRKCAKCDGEAAAEWSAWCHMHLTEYGPNNMARDMGIKIHQQPEGMKCSRCKETKPRGEFTRSCSYCRRCMNEYQTERRMMTRPKQEPEQEVLSGEEHYCRRCDARRPVERFYKKNGKPTGWCKPCTREYNKSYQAGYHGLKTFEKDLSRPKEETVARSIKPTEEDYRRMDECIDALNREILERRAQEEHDWNNPTPCPQCGGERQSKMKPKKLQLKEERDFYHYCPKCQNEKYRTHYRRKKQDDNTQFSIFGSI